MKKVLFILATVLPIVFVGCDGSINEKKFMGISGSPKSVKSTTHEAIEKFGDVVEKDVVEVVLYEFNQNGGVLKMTHYDYNGDAVFSITNKFENGKLIESKTFQKYNAISTTQTLKDRTSKRETWEEKSSDGRIVTSNVEIGSRQRITIVKDSDGNTLSKTENHFDGKGNLIEFKVYGENVVAYWTKSTFDDDSNEITKTIITDGDTKTSTYTYTYEGIDNKGNWIKRIEYLDGVLESVTIREIGY